MNTLVKQLFDRAWKETTDHHATMQRFAELIVQECANQCDLLLNNKMSSEWARGTHDSAKAIRQHFDIKE
jgi:hypothetical protein